MKGFFGIKKIQNNRGFLQISFGWLFAIIVGAIILFFAIYASVKLIKTEGTVSSSVAGREIAVLLNPLETGFGEERSTPLTTAVDSRINNGCSLFGDFGEQEISVAQKSRGEWADSGVSQIFYNKYIFSNASVEGRNFYLFSKPLNMPFNVADLIFLTSAKDSYCFADAPEYIREELEDLGQANLFTTNCPPVESQKVCAGSSPGCDIIIRENEDSVEKISAAGDVEILDYETDALMYAAIFADKDLYECQVKRLMQRLEQLALTYGNKQSVLLNVGCIAEVNVLPLASAASSLRDSEDLIYVASAAENAEDSNDDANCRLW